MTSNPRCSSSSSLPPLDQTAGKKLARLPLRRAGLRRRCRQDLLPRLPLHVARDLGDVASEADTRIAAARSRSATLLERTHPPELEDIAIGALERRLLGIEPRRIALGRQCRRCLLAHTFSMTPCDAPHPLR